MKHLYPHLIIIVAVAMSASAFDASARKINNHSRAWLDRSDSERAKMMVTNGTAPAPREFTAIVRLNEHCTTNVLRDAGIEVKLDMGDMATVALNDSTLALLEEMEEVRSISIGGRKRLKLDLAHAATRVNEAHDGIATDINPTSYTGKGVVCGLMDGGLEANHINFKNSNGTSRIERLWHITGQYGTTKEYTSSTISGFQSDDKTETHATHVAGIMAGGYRNSLTYYDAGSATGLSQKTKTGANPYYGVAYESTLAMGVGDLYDDNILLAVEKIADYASAQGMPAAINLSLGSNYGPHDGTDDFAQALDRLGEKAIICVAAGNEGEDMLSLEKTFTSTDTELKTSLYYNSSYASNIDGYLDIWGSDEESFTVTIVAVNTKSNYAETTLGTVSAANKTVTIQSKTGMSSGSITMYSALDANNDRFNVFIDCYNLKMKSGYRVGVKVKGSAGQKVNLYFDGYTEFKSNSIPGYVDGNSKQSINNMACGQNVIAVGAYTTRDTWGTKSGDVYGHSTEMTPGEISSFSSYGTLPDGTTLPHVAAPGAGIISSYSSYYLSDNDYGDSPDYMSAVATSGSSSYYWGAMDGTSMATPYMTGVAALWLQADPSLTCADIKDVIANSSIEVANEADRFGAGKLDAAAGLMYILQNNLAAIGSIDTDKSVSPLLITSSGNGLYSIALAGNATFDVMLTDMQGRTVALTHATDGMATLDASGLAKGIYVVSAYSATTSATAKIMR